MSHKKKAVRLAPERLRREIRSMRNYTPNERFKQVFKKQPVLECRLRFANGNTVLQRFSRNSMRGSRWLEGRIRKLANTGASGETILTAYTSGLRVVTRQGKARRQMSNAIAPVRRQTVAAPVAARTNVRESSEKSADDGGGDDSGGDAGPDADGPNVPGLTGFSLASGCFR